MRMPSAQRQIKAYDEEITLLSHKITAMLGPEERKQKLELARDNKLGAMQRQLKRLDTARGKAHDVLAEVRAMHEERRLMEKGMCDLGAQIEQCVCEIRLEEAQSASAQEVTADESKEQSDQLDALWAAGLLTADQVVSIRQARETMRMYEVLAFEQAETRTAAAMAPSTPLCARSAASPVHVAESPPQREAQQLVAGKRRGAPSQEMTVAAKRAAVTPSAAATGDSDAEDVDLMCTDGEEQEGLDADFVEQDDADLYACLTEAAGTVPLFRDAPTAAALS